jgi:hypothetical protein
MEWAQPLVVTSRSLQADVARDHLDDVETILHLTNGIPRGHAKG